MGRYSNDSLQCTPERAIAITDADVSVEFAAPLEGQASEEPDLLSRSQEIKVRFNFIIDCNFSK